MNKPLITYTAFRNTLTGTFLVQVDPIKKEDNTNPTSTYMFDPAEKNHHIINKELLGMTELLKHFHIIIYGT